MKVTLNGLGSFHNYLPRSKRTLSRAQRNTLRAVFELDTRGYNFDSLELATTRFQPCRTRVLHTSTPLDSSARRDTFSNFSEVPPRIRQSNLRRSNNEKENIKPDC